MAWRVALASLGNNHLWQDMGLASRAELSELLGRHFPGLVAKNTGNMKWKKFFYRQLCEREGLSICRSIVEFHRGRLWAEDNGHSTTGSGTIFIFTLPLEAT